MTELMQVFAALKEQMSATLSRSDILTSLKWLVGMLLTATLGLAAVKAPDALIILVAVLLSLSVALFLGAYIFCLVNSPDSLRSEKYSLQKLAIQHALLGDSSAGLFEEDEISGQGKIEAPSKKADNHQ